LLDAETIIVTSTATRRTGAPPSTVKWRDEDAHVIKVVTPLPDPARTLLADLVAIDAQQRVWVSFSAMRKTNGDRTIHRSDMPQSLHVPASVLDELARGGSIHWVQRGVAVDLFALIRPEQEPRTTLRAERHGDLVD
jgi:hypothetical protein